MVEEGLTTNKFGSKMWIVGSPAYVKKVEEEIILYETENEKWARKKFDNNMRGMRFEYFKKEHMRIFRKTDPLEDNRHM